MDIITALLFMIGQVTETTVTPTLTVTPTPTLPYCESTIEPTYDPLVPVITIGSPLEDTPTPSITPLVSDTPTITETVLPSITMTNTPTGNWYGFGKPINDTYTIGQYDQYTSVYTSSEYCGGNDKLSGMIIKSVNISANNYTFWREIVNGGNPSQWRNEGATLNEYLYIGRTNDGNVTNLITNKYQNIDIYPLEIYQYGGITSPLNSLQFIFATQGGNKTNYIIEPVCFKYNYILGTSTPTVTSTVTPTVTVTPNCQPYNDGYGDSDPVAIMGSELVSHNCYEVFPGLDYDPDDLPNGAKEILALLGISIPVVDIQTMSVCLNSYSIELDLLGINILPFITSCISLLAIGSIVNEFRS